MDSPLVQRQHAALSNWIVECVNGKRWQKLFVYHSFYFLPELEDLCGGKENIMENLQTGWYEVVPMIMLWGSEHAKDKEYRRNCRVFNCLNYSTVIGASMYSELLELFEMHQSNTRVTLEEYETMVLLCAFPPYYIEGNICNMVADFVTFKYIEIFFCTLDLLAERVYNLPTLQEIFDADVDSVDSLILSVIERGASVTKRYLNFPQFCKLIQEFALASPYTDLLGVLLPLPDYVINTIILIMSGTFGAKETRKIFKGCAIAHKNLVRSK